MNVYFYRRDLVNYSVEAAGEMNFLDYDDEDGEDEDDKPKKKTKKSGSSKKLSEILAGRKIYAETDAAFEEYSKAVGAFLAYKDKVGMQFSVLDQGFSIEKSSRYSYLGEDDDSSMKAQLIGNQETGPAKVVIDIVTSKLSNIHGWSAGKDTENCWKLPVSKLVIPVSPYVMTYDLSQHRSVMIYSLFLKEKVWDTTIGSKLVLAESDRKFIDLLMSSTGVQMEDIIQGKSGGVVILSTGVAGTGKTLTAEVYSEMLKKPLYNVQCSQLGVDPEKLEKKLVEVLRRAERWNAILLLDEADVYIRARGADIHHNAVVGVFLRVLEYYHGVLFMTSNQETKDIDDAIVSRATAHLKYDVPSAEIAPRIWRVLSEQFGVALNNGDIERLSKEFAGISGRSIKNLMKLSKFMSVSTKKKPTYDTVVEVSKYIDHGATKSK